MGLSTQNPDHWNRPIVAPKGPTGVMLGSAPGFRDVCVIDHPTSTLVQPNVPTRPVYAGYNFYTGEYEGVDSEYYLPGSLQQIWVREEVARGLEAVHTALLKIVPSCGGICILDGFRTDTMQQAAVETLTRKYLKEIYNISTTDKSIDLAILFDCARRARDLWEHLGLEQNEQLDEVTEKVKGDDTLINELQDIAAKDKHQEIATLTAADLENIVAEYIRIVYNTRINADRHPSILGLAPLINNGPHLTGGATDAKLIGIDGNLLVSHTPFDYSYHDLSSELTLETPEGIEKLRAEAMNDRWLQRHYKKQGMNPKNITDADISRMRMHQRCQTHVLMAAGAIPYLEKENWHCDWTTDPRDPLTGNLLAPPSVFRNMGWDSGNPSYVTERYAPGKYATKTNPNGVPAVFGGKQAFRQARRLGIID